MSARNTLQAKARRRAQRAEADAAHRQRQMDAMQARARQDQLCDLGATFMIVQGLMVAGSQVGLGGEVSRWQP